MHARVESTLLCVIRWRHLRTEWRMKWYSASVVDLCSVVPVVAEIEISKWRHELTQNVRSRHMHSARESVLRKFTTHNARIRTTRLQGTVPFTHFSKCSSRVVPICTPIVYLSYNSKHEKQDEYRNVPSSGDHIFVSDSIIILGMDDDAHCSE